jgi:hypothetical protein
VSARHRILDVGAALQWGARALEEALALPLPALERRGERARAIIASLRDATSEAEKSARLFAASAAAQPR